MPPVSSPPSAVNSQPSSGPTLVKPRKIQVGTDTMSPAFPTISPSSPFGPQRNFHSPLKTEKNLRGEVDVQVVRDAVRHGGRADIKAVRLSQIDDLIGARRHAGSDERVVLLEVRSGRLAVDEGDGARHVVRTLDEALAPPLPGRRSGRSWHSSLFKF